MLPLQHHATDEVLVLQNSQASLQLEQARSENKTSKKRMSNKVKGSSFEWRKKVSPSSTLTKSMIELATAPRPGLAALTSS